MRGESDPKKKETMRRKLKKDLEMSISALEKLEKRSGRITGNLVQKSEKLAIMGGIAHASAA